VNIELGHLQGAGSRRDAHQIATGPVSKEALRLKIYLALMVVDSLAVIGGFTAGNLVRFGAPLNVQGFNMCLVVLPVFLGTAINSRAYSMDVLNHSRRGAYRALTALLFAAVAVTFIAFYLQAGLDFSRVVFTIGTAVSGVLLLLGRQAMAVLARRSYGDSPLSEVVIRDGRDCVAGRGAYVVDAEELDLRPDVADPMMLDRIGRMLKNADRVIVSCPPERRAQWAVVLKGANISGELLDDELDELGAIGTSRYVSQATAVVSAGPLALRDRAVKRLLDLSLAGAALLLLAPLMIVVAIVIRLDSPGPVFFLQDRLGRGNRLFRMYKFRSMRSDLADGAGKQSTRRDDDRVTRVGRFIRSTSIDELPQIFNVLIGDMSLVGPRPHALGSTAGDELFWEVDTRYWHRHASKPGLTGLAQVRGFRGATHSRSDLTNRLQADLEYLAGWTIWRDISIIFATFRVLVHKNAF
jgi:lipopolysaccharide/colanic/teichoic acid biosynthesis glycosyltransferase